MNTQFTKAASQEDQSDNYRNPGNSGSAPTLGPSTTEMLNLLSDIENRLAA